MAFFDRFTSSKGKESANKPKSGRVAADDAKQKAFANVPAGDEKPKKEAKPKSDPPKAAASAESTDRAYHILLRAIVTEKSTMINKNSQYAFMIAPSATKVDVRQAVQHVYGVRPVSVNIINLPGKWVRYGRTEGRTAQRRKAIVTLPAGKTIDTSK